MIRPTGVDRHRTVSCWIMRVIDAGGSAFRFAVLAVAAAVGGPLPAQERPAEPAGVADGFHTALAAGDSSAALALLDPEVVIFEGGGVERSREEYRRHHLAADMAFAAATQREVTQRAERVYGDLAVVLSEVRTRGEFRGRAIDRDGVETMVLRRTPSGWRIVHIHWSSRGS